MREEKKDTKSGIDSTLKEEDRKEEGLSGRYNLVSENSLRINWVVIFSFIYFLHLVG